MWESILSLVGNLAAPLIANKMAAKQGDSSPEYKNAFSQSGESIGQTQDLADKYTGNEGYENTLEQAGKGASTLANQAVGTATSGARQAGMSKAQAAAMGLQSGNQAYANAFQGQQGMAQGMGNQAISAQQGITGALQGQTGQAASETQAKYGRRADTMSRVSDAAGQAIGTGLNRQ